MGKYKKTTQNFIDFAIKPIKIWFFFLKKKIFMILYTETAENKSVFRIDNSLYVML